MTDPSLDRLTRGTELVGRPIVTMGGDDIAEVKDVVFEPARGSLLGFTLNRRGFFGRHLKQVLLLDGIRSIGRDAVMVDGEHTIAEPDEAPDEVTEVTSDRNVLGALVMTEGGTKLGEVTDVVIGLGEGAEVVGYELGGEAVAAARGGRTLFLPLPEQVAVSGAALVVPDEVEDFVRDDLSGFGAAVAEFRSRLGASTSASGSGTSTERSKRELYEAAKRRGIAGRSKMTKAELERALS